jgi:hypothetical protein
MWGVPRAIPVGRPTLNAGRGSNDGWHRGGGAALTDAFDMFLSLLNRLDHTLDLIHCDIRNARNST